jgi:predicted Zn finger-like uncharacterized protein
MIIACPNCEAEYDVPDHVLEGAGRTLRCKSCTEEWRATLPIAELDAALPTASEANPEPEPPEPQPVTDIHKAMPPKRRRLPWMAPAASWAASLLLLLSAGAASVRWHTAIAAAWPPSERLFRTLPHAAEPRQDPAPASARENAALPHEKPKHPG